MSAFSKQISGKDLVIAALKHEALPKLPWVPFAGVHAGKLKGYTARQVLTDKDRLIESLLEVNKIYDPDGQPVLFDLQVEAEILGCKLLWAENSPPSVATHPLAAKMEVPTIIPEKTDGRLPLILDAMQTMKETVGKQTALYGLVTGPMTLASHLRGTELFMDMFDHPDFARELIAFTERVAERMTGLYISAGMDVIAVVDPVVSQISPRHFTQYLHRPYADIFKLIREKHACSSFFVCGDATKNIEVMCKTAPDCIAVDENIDLVAAKKITDRYNITIEGNIPLTTRMLLGNQQDNMKYVTDLYGQLGFYENELRNFILSPGCDMPYDTPLENVIGVLQAARDPLPTRQILANYTAQANLPEVTLPDYQHLARPLIEVFTLDSASCAACAYMLDAAQRVTNEMDGQVDMVEYKITKPENIARLLKMGIQHLPSILINGDLKFSSIIPSNKEFKDEMQKYVK